MIKDLDELRDKLDVYYKGKWSVGETPRELEIDEEWIVLSFISGTVDVADDSIYKQNSLYQIAFYSTDPLANVDVFFLKNNIIYSLKTQTYIDAENGYQTIYEFHI